MTRGAIEVATTTEVAFVRVRGAGGFDLSGPLRRFVGEMLDRGTSGFVVDLGECTSMDSTFMGALTAIARDVGRRCAGKRVVLARLGEGNRGLLATLGILRLFDASPNEPASVTPAAFEPPALSPAELLREVLEAHRALSAVSELNALEFRDVCEVLERELAAKSAEPSPRSR